MNDTKYKPMKKWYKNTQLEAKFTCKDCFAFSNDSGSNQYSNSNDDDDAFFYEENGEPRPTVYLIGNLMLPDSLVDEIVHQTNLYSFWRLDQPEWIIDPVTKEETKNNQYLNKNHCIILDQSGKSHCFLSMFIIESILF